MKILKMLLICSMILSFSGLAYSASDDDDGSDRNGGNQALTGAVMGGLLGAGLGAAIGSASGKAGTGAAIGAGVGAVGGTLLGASQRSGESQRSYSGQEYSRPEIAQAGQAAESEATAPKLPKDAKIKKRVVRQYDEQGNVISEKEVKD